jgi:hypothetical protein
MSESTTPQATMYACEMPNPKAEAWKGIDRSGTIGYKSVDKNASAIGIKAAVAAAKGDTRSKPHYVAIRSGVLVVATGPNYAAPSGASDSIVAQIQLKGCTIKNESVGGDEKFAVNMADGTKHVFKLDSSHDLREWLLDIEAVFKGVHAPPPDRCRLLVGPDGLKVLPVESDAVINHWPYDKIKKFQCLSERTVSVVVEVHGADVERYFRSLDSKAREIVALITAFVKELVAQRVKAAEIEAAAAAAASESGGRRRRRRKSKKSSKSSSRSARRDSNSDSRSRSGSFSGSGSADDDDFSEESGELHPDWKPAGEGRSLVFVSLALTPQPYQRPQTARFITTTYTQKPRSGPSQSPIEPGAQLQTAQQKNSVEF